MLSLKVGVCATVSLTSDISHVIGGLPLAAD